MSRNGVNKRWLVNFSLVFQPIIESGVKALQQASAVAIARDINQAEAIQEKNGKTVPVIEGAAGSAR